MTPKARRQALLVVGVVVVIAGVVYPTRQEDAPAGGAASPSNPVSNTGQPRGDMPVVDVQLEL
jgi:hypothetical protein